MTETLHWYAETSGGVRQGSCAVTENGGVLHLSADLPAGTLKTVRAELPWTMEAEIGRASCRERVSSPV